MGRKGELAMNRLHKQVKAWGALATLLVATMLCCPSVPPEILTPSSTGRKVTLPPTFTPAATITPTFLREGEAWIVDNLAITVSGHELGGCYISEHGSQICPPEGAAYLWVHLSRGNVGDSSDLPIYSCFWVSLLYQGDELQPTWDGDYYPGRPSWSGGGCKKLYSGNSDEGWVCFEVPAGIDLSQATLYVESYQGPEFEQQWKLMD